MSLINFSQYEQTYNQQNIEFKNLISIINDHITSNQNACDRDKSCIVEAKMSDLKEIQNVLQTVTDEMHSLSKNEEITYYILKYDELIKKIIDCKKALSNFTTFII